MGVPSAALEDVASAMGSETIMIIALKCPAAGGSELSSADQAGRAEKNQHQQSLSLGNDRRATSDLSAGE